MSPSPSRLHQRAVGRLLRLLDDACPSGMEVLCGPSDVVLAYDTVIIPDLLVAHRTDPTERDLATAPTLAVEVLSPSTRRFDLMTKRSRYEAAGANSYWVVDPDEPSLTAWELDEGGAYQQVAQVVADETFRTSLPFDVSIVPASLVRDH